MNPKAVWSFIAGDSKITPLAVALAVIVAVVLVHAVPAAGMMVGVIFVAIIAVGLVAGVFERV